MTSAPRSPTSTPAAADVAGPARAAAALHHAAAARPRLEAYADDVLVVPKLPAAVRYSVYAATFYLTMLFGNFGGAEFIYFQF